MDNNIIDKLKEKGVTEDEMTELVNSLKQNTVMTGEEVLMTNFIQVVGEGIKNFGTKWWIYLYRFSILFTILCFIYGLFIHGGLDSKDVATLLAALIGFVLGKTSFFG